MNFLLSDLPDCGENPIVFMDIMINEELVGTLHILLHRAVFPAGVENFVRIADGKTFRTIPKGSGRFKFCKQIIRSYEGCKFFNFSHNNYIVSGDIYNNDGSDAGTVFNDQPIPPMFGDYFYSHGGKGLVSLIPFKDEATGKTFYDSTFLITLADLKYSTISTDLDKDHVVIGEIYQGLDILDKINQLIKPYARRKYPTITIGKSGLYKRNGYII